MEYIENRTFDEIQIGDTASLTRTLAQDDIEMFAVMSGDVNPAHVDTSTLAATCSTRSSPTACGEER